MQNPKRRQYKCAKSRYRVKNWGEYEASLRRRGDLTVWLSDEALDAWRAPASGKPGGQRRYADIAIEAALTIRMVFHLPLRQTEGFLYSLMQLLDIDLPIPDHTTLSRRLQTLGEIKFQPATHGPLHLLIAGSSTWITRMGLLENHPSACRESSKSGCSRFATGEVASAVVPPPWNFVANGQAGHWIRRWRGARSPMCIMIKVPLRGAERDLYDKTVFHASDLAASVSSIRTTPWSVERKKAKVAPWCTLEGGSISTAKGSHSEGSTSKIHRQADGWSSKRPIRVIHVGANG